MKNLALVACTVVGTFLFGSSLTYADDWSGSIKKIAACHDDNGTRYTIAKIYQGSSYKWIIIGQETNSVGDDTRSANASLALAAFLSGKEISIIYHAQTDTKCSISTAGYVRLADGNRIIISD